MDFTSLIRSTGSVTSLAMILIVSISPFFVPIFIYISRDHLYEPLFLEKFSSLYIGLKAKISLIMSYSFIFLERRLIFGITTVLLVKKGLI